MKRSVYCSGCDTLATYAEGHRIFRNVIVRLGVIGFVLVTAVAPAWAGHDKTDIAKTEDGSIYIGEIKSVQYATLTLSTHAASTLSIEWRHVTSLESKFEYRIELPGGVRHFGTLGHSEKPKHLSIVTPSGTIEVELAEVAQIVPIEHGFWKRMDGSVNFGFSFTQANEAIQYNLSGDAFTRTPKTYTSLSGQSIFNTQEGGEATDQHSLTLVSARIGKKKWGSFGLGGLQSNADQGYDLRSVVGGGATYFFIEGSGKFLLLILGPVYNREEVTDSSEVDDSAEALVGLAFRRFKRGSHSPSVLFSLETYTNLSETPRFRTALNFQVSWKVIGNFSFSVQVNNNYDSDPPGTDPNKNNLVMTSSVGYTF